MKKKLVCLLLVLCTVLAVVPAFMMAAFGDGADSSASVSVPKYDDLYVTDYLRVHLVADAASVDLVRGTWTSKVGDVVATLGSNNATKWQLGDNGLFYRYSSIDEYGNGRDKVGIDIPGSVIGDGEFTMDIAFKPLYITDESGNIIPHSNSASLGNAYGAYGGRTSTFSIGGLQMCFFQPSTYINDKGSHSGNSSRVRFFYSNGSWSSVSDKIAYSDERPFGIYDSVSGSVTDEMLRESTVLSVTRVLKDSAGKKYQPMEISAKIGLNSYVVSNGSGDTLGSAATKDLQNNFYTVDTLEKPIGLFYGFPAEVTEIRIYDHALTKEQAMQNAFAALAKTVKLDLTDYAGMMGDEGLRYAVHKAVVALGSSTPKAELQQAILDAKAAYDEEQALLEAEKKALEELMSSLDNRAIDEYDEYYVQDGLKIFLDGFVTIPEWNTNLDLENGTWTSKVGDVTASIGGKEYWRVNSTGKGVGYRLTKDEYYASLVSGICPVDISFDPTLLPKNFTVETVAQFVGLTDAEGNRHVDPPSGQRYGIYTARYSTFSFGAFKSMSFLCESHAKDGTPMGNRWLVTSKEWHEHNGSDGYAEEWLFKDMDPTVPYSFTMIKYEPNSTTTAMEIYADMATAPQLARRYTTMSDTEPEFHLFKGVASTVYAIRVYDRKLSVEEQAQNHMADLLSFYNLDTAFLDMVLGNAEDASDVYLLFNSLGFDMTKEEAEVNFRDCLIGVWLKQLGVAGRLDGKIALRAEFELDMSAIELLTDSGYKVESGALLNMEADVFPTLDANEYKVVFLTEEGVLNDQFVVSESNSGIVRVAFAVNYNKPTPEMSVTDLYWAGYVTITAPDGEKFTLHSKVEPANFDTNVLSYYDHLRLAYGYGDNSFICGVVDNAYVQEEIVVDAENGDDENDGKTSPVKTLDRAYELLLELLNAPSTVPMDVTVNVAAGKYALEDKLELDGSEISLKYVRITIKGAEDDGTKITRNKEFAGKFTKVDGTDYYVHQFEKDAENKYPSFRTFYVNGEVQKMATNGFSRGYEARAAGGKLMDAMGNYVTLDPNGGGAGAPVYITTEGSDGVYGYDNMWIIPWEFDSIDNRTDNPGKKLYLHAEAFENTTDEDFATGDMELHVGMAWYQCVLHIDRVDRSDTKLGIDGKTQYVAVYFDAEEINKYSNSKHTFNGWYYWVENALSFVDEPGEYYYDEAEGKLYYYPAEDVDMETAEFEYPTGGHMLSFFNLSNLTLDSLVFYGNDNRQWEENSYLGAQASTSNGDYECANLTGLTVLWLDNTINTTVKNCLFTDIASSGVKFMGVTKNATIDSNRFFEVGSSAIEVGERDGFWDEKKNANVNIVITNNFLNDIAWLTRGSVAIIVGVGKEVDISHNSVWNTSYSAISVGWRWDPADWDFGQEWHLYHVDIHHNYFRGVMYGLSDGGVYTLGGNVKVEYHEYFNYMHHNFFYFGEASWNGNSETIIMPFYHDGGSSNWRTYENVQILNPYRSVLAPHYVQNIQDQLVMNIMVEGNEIVGAFKSWSVYDEGEDLTDMQWEYKIFGEDEYRQLPAHEQDGEFRYYSRVDENRFISQKNNYVYDDPSMLGDVGYPMNIIDKSGSSFARPDADAIVYDEIQPIYDQYYEELEEAFRNAN